VNKAYMAALRTPDLHLRGIMFSMVSSLGTVRHSLKFAAYSESAVEYLWEPLDFTLNTIRVEVICRLRAGQDDRVFKADLGELSRDLRRRVTEATAHYMEARADGRAKAIAESELARFGFATREIARFTALLGDFIFRLENPPSRIRTGWELVKFRVKEWLKRPLFESLNPPTPWRFRLAFPIRSGLGACIAAWIILGIGEALEEVQQYGTDGHLEEGDMILRSLYRAVLTLCGVILATLISALVLPVFAYGRLTRATARSLQMIGDTVAECVDRIQTATVADRLPPGSVDERVVSIGDELMKHHQERWSQVMDATVETKLFSLLRGYFRSEERRVNASHIIAAQPLLDRLNRRTMVVVSAAACFHPSWKSLSPELERALQALTVFAEDMRTAAQELAGVTLKHGSHLGLWESRTGRFDEAVSLLGKVERLMGEARQKIRKTSKKVPSNGDGNGNCVPEESDLDDLYSLVRALGVFVEAWKHVEYMMYFGYLRGSINPFDLKTMQSKSVDMSRRTSTGGVPRLRTHSFAPPLSGQV
ncbi:Aluminum-activated malate transporter 1, partial [Perkinsus olseni]